MPLQLIIIFIIINLTNTKQIILLYEYLPSYQEQGEQFSRVRGAEMGKAVVNVTPFVTRDLSKGHC